VLRKPGAEVVRAVRQSSLPTLLMRVPSEEIVAASDEAGRLLGVAADDLVGRNVEDFAADTPTGALPLVVSGRLSGFQARRRLRGADGVSQPLQAWVRAADPMTPVGLAVVVLWPGGRSAWSYLPTNDNEYAGETVVGTANGQLELERVSDDVRILGLTPEEAIGGSVFRLFDTTSVADVLHALVEATDGHRAVSVAVNVHLNGKPAMAELMLRPLHPAPSFSFSMACGGHDAAERMNDAATIQRVGRGLHALALADALSFLHEANIPGVEKLTTRELDITARLISGDRVPAIASDIYLSQSTVRNHLSRVFRKLGVSSQQELIEMARETAERLAEHDTSST
jgi:DNA-binding CsgD family transcriptional regulator